MRHKLKWNGTGSFADEILTRDALNQTQYTEALQLYLESLRTDNLSDLNIIKPSLSVEEYSEFLKKRKENKQ